MKIIEIAAQKNGAHRNKNGNFSSVPEGWAVIPDNMVCENFPFGEVKAEVLPPDASNYEVKNVGTEPETNVTTWALYDKKSGMRLATVEAETEQQARDELFAYLEAEKIGYVMTVTSWTAGTIPEPEPEPEPEPTTKEILDALLGVE